MNSNPYRNWLRVALGGLVVVATCVFFYRWLSSSTPPLPAPEVLVEEALPVGEANPAMAADATRDLSSHGHQATPQLRRVLAESREPAVRAAAIDGLSRNRDWQSMPQFIDLMEDPDPRVRGSAGAAAQKMLKANVYFRSNDPPDERARTIAYIKRLYAIAQTNDAGD